MTVAVYAHRNFAGEVIYIGISSRLASRTQAHRKCALWRDEIASVEVLLELDSRDEAHEREVAFIRAYRPKHNTANNYETRCERCRELVRPAYIEAASIAARARSGMAS